LGLKNELAILELDGKKATKEAFNARVSKVDTILDQINLQV
jgi:hypothetical protein